MAPSAPEPPPPPDARLRAAFAIDSDVLDVAVTDRVTRAGDLAVKSFGPEQIPRARLEAAVLSHLHQAAASNLLEEILGTGYRVPSIVRTRTDDRRVRVHLGPALREHVACLGLEFVFMAARLRESDCAFDALGRQFSVAAQDLDLPRRLDDA